MTKVIGVISIDKSNREDYTCVAYKCGNCNSIIAVKLYQFNANPIDIQDVKECPVCKKQIKRIIPCI